VAFTVEVQRRFRARQGLKGAVRSVLASGSDVPVVLKIGVTFEDSQLTADGWFFDTDLVGDLLEKCCAELSGAPWTALFPFRPTFELVARHLYQRLSSQIRQLTFVELRDESFGTITRYHAS
jgi:6-pyruvoyltetrahydropterin/6-carboxytetrahydropterin synthase